ncbi:MAG TPA: M17 family peptidase N-terminal domain-containing protein [Myxococcales bacterium]|nr:M17 family peptidase N-terminal domain-containing protein [Myxococcales bacterium]
MDLTFFPLTLEAIDQAAAESLCLFVGKDERPLTGLAGLVDWRLLARLSRLLRAGQITGDTGEAVLTSPGARLGFRKMFLFGIGAADQSEHELQLRVSESLRKLSQAGVRDTALQLPARLSPEAGVRTLLDEMQGSGRAVVFAPEPQRMVAALSKMARGQARIEQRTVKVASPQPAAGSAPEPPIAPPVESRPAPPQPGDRKTAVPPPQRYVPMPAKQNVFKKKK